MDKPVLSRLTSLDVLRGLTIALMILVNTSGDGKHTYALLEHAAWNGLTIADIVFPCFLFMVGISVAISLTGRLKRGVTHGAILLQAARRSAVLFVLGLAVNSFPFFDLHTLRIFGVLQRIAICSFIATVLFLRARPRTIFVLTAGILVGYWALLRWTPVPGVGVAFMDTHNNLPAWVDRHLLPVNHLYSAGYYDPEGLLSTFPSIATSLLGLLAGMWIVRHGRSYLTAKRLGAAGATCLLVGLLWSLWFPLNKRLWTSSFVLLNAGLDMLMLGLLLWQIDLRDKAKRLLYPTLVFGTNPLAAYIFSEFLAAGLSSFHVPGSRLNLQQWIYQPLAAHISNPYMASLVYAVLFVGVCFVPVAVLYRRKIYLRL